MVTGAIETPYKGYRFRSRLEARYAVFFDVLDVEWEYEKQGYDLGSLGWYLPDFYLPTLSMWVEIKGEKPTDQEQRKCRALRSLTERAVYLISGPPMDQSGMLYCFDVGDGSAGESEVKAIFGCNDATHDPEIGVWDLGSHDLTTVGFDEILPVVCMSDPDYFCLNDFEQRAAEMAKAARFEAMDCYLERLAQPNQQSWNSNPFALNPAIHAATAAKPKQDEPDEFPEAPDLN